MMPSYNTMEINSPIKADGYSGVGNIQEYKNKHIAFFSNLMTLILVLSIGLP